MISALCLALGTIVVLISCGGLVAHRLFPPWSTLFERIVVRCVLGAAVLPFLLIAAYELFGIRVRLASALAITVLGLIMVGTDEIGRWRRRWSGASWRLATSDELIVLLLSFGVMLSCFVGSARYPLFEGRDPLGHVLGVAYLLETGELRQPFDDWPVIHYIDGYPPLYDLFLAMPAAVSPSRGLSLKASNSIIVGLFSPVFFLLVRRLSRSPTLAMIATALLAVLPGSLTRQIWGHSLAVLLLFTGLMCAVRCRARRTWTFPAAVAFAGVLLAAPSQGVKALCVLFLTTMLAFMISRAWAMRLSVVAMLAGVLSLVWYLPLAWRVELSPRGIFHAMDEPALRRTMLRWGHEPGSEMQGLRSALLGSGHSATNLDDFLFLRPHEFMRRWFPEKALGNVVPQGLGSAVTVLALLCVAASPGRWFRRRSRRRAGWRELVLVWLGFALVGLFGRYLGIGFYVWRFWMLVCPLACVAAAERIVALGRAWPRDRGARWSLLAVATLAVAHAVTCLLWEGEPLLWNLLHVNPPFLLVLLAVVVWLALAHGGSLLGLTRPSFAVIAVLILAHVCVAAPTRLRALTAFVKPSIMCDGVEYSGYARVVESTEPGAAVFPLSDDDHCSALIALDRCCRPWSIQERKLREQIQRHHQLPDPDGLVRWLQAQRYSYVVVDPSFQRLLLSWLGAAEARAYLRSLLHHPATRVVLAVSSEPPDPPSDFYLLQIPSRGDPDEELEGEAR